MAASDDAAHAQRLISGPTPVAAPFVNRATAHRPRAEHMGAVCSALGVLSMALTNKMRHRPLLYRASAAAGLDVPMCGVASRAHPSPFPPPTEPWLHVGLALAGAYLGGRLGQLYDDVGATKDRQAAAFTALPSWAYAQLSPAELAAETRDQRLATLRVKFADLAALEEAEYIAKRSELSASDVATLKAEGSVKLL